MAGATLAVALLPIARRLPNFLIPDDGYFYSQIAFNVATRGHSTFDGIHTTSGYHLPWALVLAAVSALLRFVTLDKGVHLAAHLTVAFAIAIGTCRHFFASRLFRIAAFVVLVTSFSMTEMVLVAPVMLGLFRSVENGNGASPRGERWLAFVLPIVRVDCCVVGLTAAAVIGLRDRRRALELALATLLGVTVQLATMKLAFGHFIGVAASLKASSSIVTPVMNLRFNLAESVFQTSLMGSLVLFAAVAVVLRRDGALPAAALASLSFIVMHTSLSLLRGWYVVPTALGVLFALERASVCAARARLAGVARALVAFMAVVVVVRAVRAELVYADDQRIAATFLSALRARVPADASVYTWDNPGFLGFFSGRRVVDGDGLVNDHEYARRLRGGTLAGYLDDERICYVVISVAEDDPVLDVAGLVLRRADVEQLYVIRRKQSSQADFELDRIASERCVLR